MSGITLNTGENTITLITKSGARGIQGEKGDKGLNAFEVWKLQNPSGTYEEWIAELQEPAQIAADLVLNNIVALELHEDDMSLWMVTPDNYEGITFEINEKGELIANY